MKKTLLFALMLHSQVLSQEEVSPEFDYSFKGDYAAPVEYFTEPYYRPDVHLVNLKFEKDGLDSNIEAEIFRTLKLAIMACKEKSGKDYFISENSDLFAYILKISGETFTDAKPLSMTKAAELMTKHISKNRTKNR
jgi:hypothetical protein